MSSKNQRRRAKKLEKKRKSRAKAQSTRGSRDGMGSQGGKARVETTLRWPVNECYLSADWHEQGARVHALFSRRSARGRIAAAIFEVDLAEEGVVSAKLKTGLNDLELQVELATLSSEENPMVTVDAAHLVKLVRAGWEHGQANGKHQDGRYQKAARLFGDTDPSECDLDILVGTETARPTKADGGLLASLKHRLFSRQGS